MLQQINFFECMGVLFTAILAILFAFVMWGFFKVRAEMRKEPTSDESMSEKPNNCKKFDMKGYENVIIHEGNAKGYILKGGEQ